MKFTNLFTLKISCNAPYKDFTESNLSSLSLDTMNYSWLINWGIVLGIHIIEVIPPLAADALSIVSLCSNPGSVIFTLMSTRPAATYNPSHSTQ